MTNQKTTQMIMQTQAALKETQGTERIALFDESGAALVLDDISATGATVIMTNYESGSASAVEDTDTVNEAIAKVEAGVVAAQATADAAESVPDTGATVLLTSYSTSPGSGGSVAATDTLNAAIRRLEDRIVTLESA